MLVQPRLALCIKLLAVQRISSPTWKRRANAGSKGLENVWTPQARVQKASLIESEGCEEGQAQWWCGLVPLNRGGNKVTVRCYCPERSRSVRSSKTAAFRSSATIPPSRSLDDLQFKRGPRGEQFLIINHTVNQRNGSEVSKI